MLNFLSRYKLVGIGVTTLVALVILVVFIWTYTISQKSPSPAPPTPTPIPLKSPAQLPNLQKTVIGKTTLQEIQNIPGITKISENKYSYSSYLGSRPNEIQVDKNTTAFERVLVPISTSDPNFTTISELIEKFGEADKVIPGSKFYGYFPFTYIYASQGMTFIGNPNTNEVYEIQFFRPMSIQEYTELFGGDILEDARPPVERYENTTPGS